ncbi:hypothetical protein N1M2_124 [Klebsiella phage N1M2]|uniref:Uncharacterized protein n=1 Tax=Klebsiella phage N1M2 TaxID=2664939 RepID=A0A6B7ZES0_9CAUD|nr:hypothetical protein PQB72_gp124 [Klebsiella phage N1M2]QGH71987.1 hypothetical protein N1M2_124 [Klebsiella phage N1M2]
MNFESSIIFTEGPLQVTLKGLYPTKGKKREKLIIDHVGHPVIEWSVEGEGLEPISSRQTVIRALGVCANDMFNGFPECHKDYKRSWHMLIQKLGKRSYASTLQAELDRYRSEMKPSYHSEPTFKVRERDAVITLFKPDTGDDEFKLSFKVSKPSHYSVHGNIAIRCNGVIRRITYARDFGVDNIPYLLNQIKEWLDIAAESHRLDKSRVNIMLNNIEGYLNKKEPAINYLLSNLNAGNNL